MYDVEFNNFSQNLVSLASFNEMCILVKKSALLWANCASAMLAPIEVPDLRTCFDMTVSLFSFTRYLYKFTILIANF